MARKRRNYIYTREQGGEVRYYGDFREFDDVGGKREALIPEGADRATTDRALAQSLVAQRIAELESRRRRKQRGEPEEDTYLAAYAVYHLKKKRLSGKFSEQWLDAAENHLVAAIEFFCNRGVGLPKDAEGSALLTGIEDRDITGIRVTEVQQYAEWLAQRSCRGGEAKLSPSSQRKYLNSLSNLYARAISEEKASFNPVSALIEKPQDRHGRGESHWLEVHDAALLLEAARLYTPERPWVSISPQTLHAVIGTMLLTGGRPDEVFGLAIEDISFERCTVTFRPNDSRSSLKTAGSTRVVPLWPQLEEILTAYLKERGNPESGLLFPSNRTGGKIDDIRKALDTIAVAAGWKPGDIRPYAFRHTYCSARLQTVDHGYPVSEFTVARELGHNGTALVKKVYGHLGSVRHRGEVVEYRVEQHFAKLAAKLAKLRGLSAA